MAKPKKKTTSKSKAAKVVKKAPAVKAKPKVAVKPVKKAAPASKKPEAKKVVAKKAAPAPKKAEAKKPLKKVEVKAGKPAKAVEKKVAKKVEVKAIAPKKEDKKAAAAAAKLAAKEAKAKEKEAKKAAKEKLKLDKKKKGKGASSFDEFEGEEDSAPKRKTEEDDDFDDLAFMASEDKKGNKHPKYGMGKNDFEFIEEKITEKITDLSEFFSWTEIEDAVLSMKLFLSEGDECMEKMCDNIRTTGPYCRLHYIQNWKLLTKKKEIFKEGKLQSLIEELVEKYPIEYIQAVLDDLTDEREFNRVLAELNISDNEFEDVEEFVADDDEDDDIEVETRSFSGTIRTGVDDD